MKRLQPVIWSKGTFLTPQHLQVQDKFIEDTLTFRLQALKFCPWGFSELALNQELLPKASLRFRVRLAFFPDGLLFDIPDADPPPPSKALPSFLIPATKSLDIYLTVPDYRQRGLNVSAGPDGDTRYVAPGHFFPRRKHRHRRQAGQGGAQEPAPAGGKRKSRREFSAAHRQCGEDRSRHLSAEPAIHSSPDRDTRQRISGRIVARANRSDVSQEHRTVRHGQAKNQSLADFTAADIANFWLLYTVNSHFPIFSHLFESNKQPSRRTIFGHGFAGGFADDFLAESAAARLAALCARLAGSAVRRTGREATFHARNGSADQSGVFAAEMVKTSVYATAIDNEKYLRNTRMYLAVNAETKEDDVIRDVPRLVKVCSATHIEHLIKQALPGIQLKHLPSPPSALSVKLKYQYFSLNQSGAAWEAVTRARNLAAYVPEISLIRIWSC